VSKSERSVRGSDLISEQISELTSCSLIGSERSEACSVLLSEQKRRGAEHQSGRGKPRRGIGNPVHRHLA
jgi:hypothetical protein